MSQMSSTPLPKHASQHVYVGDRRFYRLPSGELAVGVTTLLAATKDAEALDAWKDKNTGEALQRVGNELRIVTPYQDRIIAAVKARKGRWDEQARAWVMALEHEPAIRALVLELYGTTTNLAEAISERARNRGTGMHARIEAYLQGLPAPQDDLALQAEPYWASVQPYVETLTDVKLIEGTIWHPEGWAGSVDCIARIRWPETGQWVLAIVDWKTADREKQWRYITDYRQQVAAYAAAANRTYQDLGIRIGHAVVVVAIPNRPPQLFHLSPAQLREELELFRVRVAMFKQLQAA